MHRSGREVEGEVRRSQVSAAKLPLVSFPLVDMLEEFGLLRVFRLLVSETAPAAALLHLHTFAAVNV